MFRTWYTRMFFLPMIPLDDVSFCVCLAVLEDGPGTDGASRALPSAMLADDREGGRQGRQEERGAAPSSAQSHEETEPRVWRVYGAVSVCVCSECVHVCACTCAEWTFLSLKALQIAQTRFK